MELLRLDVFRAHFLQHPKQKADTQLHHGKAREISITTSEHDPVAVFILAQLRS